MMVAACGKPEVNACEAFIKDRLKAPSTYRRVSVEQRDEHLSTADFLKTTKKKALSELSKRFYSEHQSGIRYVRVTYDADNSFAAPLRSTEECAFELVDGKLWSDHLDLDVQSASAAWNFRQTGRAGGLPNVDTSSFGPEPAHSCCMPEAF